VLVAKTLRFLLGQSIESVVEVSSFASLVLPSDIPGQEGTYEEYKSGSGEIDSIAWKVSRSEVGGISPGTDD